MKRIVIKVLDGEYQVPGQTAREAEIYFTDDRIDAIQTAYFIHGKEISINFKKMEE